MRPTNAHIYQLVLTTCPDSTVAERLAHGLVENGNAACVNVILVSKSIYRWKGKVESAAEQLLVIKGRSADYKKIEKYILDHHPYETPEVIAVPIVEGSARYLSWIDDPDQT